MADGEVFIFPAKFCIDLGRAIGYNKMNDV